MKEFFTWKIITATIVVAIAVIIGFLSIKPLGNDNAIEEVAEAVIQSQTGVDIDLSPTAQPNVSK